MRWEDADYVKLYTYDSPEWLTVPLQSRCFYYELMRKCDRAGVIRLGRHGVTALAAAVRGTVEQIEQWLPPLIEDGCVKQTEDRLILPNFVAAQAARSTDRSRKERQRQKDRDLALFESDPVTRCHAVSENVTRRGEERRGERELATEPPDGGGSPRVSKKTPDPLRRILADALVECGKRERSGCFAFSGPADAQGVSRLLGWSRDVDDHVRRFQAALRSPQEAYGYRVDSIHTFATARVWNHFAPTRASPPKVRALKSPGEPGGGEV
jgi:hypothetical protein